MAVRDRKSGVVLAMVLILALVLSAAVVTFTRRAVMDRMIVRNRENLASAEALARGGVQIATGILAGQTLLKISKLVGEDLPETPIGDSTEDLSVRAGDYEIVTPSGGTLRIQIASSGTRLNLNSLMKRNKETKELEAHPSAEEFLVEFFEHVTNDMDELEEHESYDARELARSLLDYLDSDETSHTGGDEDSYYLDQDPPYRAANRPLMSVHELSLVEGFDTALAEALKPYVTVYPFTGAFGVDINSAPPHVLASASHGTEASRRLLGEDEVRQILRYREEGSIFCSATEKDPDRCRTLAEANLEGELFPPVRLPAISRTFTVVARARVGEIERSAEAVVSFESFAEPRLLSWRLR
ncbi:MAG: general secretion pathway protein GspK [Deltaproteobacteria bacterium]|nr:general secretion pathway protein GspK [Deltaproteobacteria bacterium]